jgi:hypothetical protein
MNILFWILQILLALYYVMGGAYQLSNFDKLAKGVKYLKALPKPVWMLMAALQVLFAVSLLVPHLSAVAAACLALQALLVSGLHLKYGSFGSILWTLLPGILAAFVAYGRYAILPY